MAATAHKGLMELEATPPQTMDTSAPSEAAFSGVMSDASASVKASTRFQGSLFGSSATCIVVSFHQWLGAWGRLRSAPS